MVGDGRENLFAMCMESFYFLSNFLVIHVYSYYTGVRAPSVAISNDGVERDFQIPPSHSLLHNLLSFTLMDMPVGATTVLVPPISPRPYVRKRFSTTLILFIFYLMVFQDGCCSSRVMRHTLLCLFINILFSLREPW